MTLCKPLDFELHTGTHVSSLPVLHVWSPQEAAQAKSDAAAAQAQLVQARERLADIKQEQHAALRWVPFKCFGGERIVLAYQWRILVVSLSYICVSLSYICAIDWEREVCQFVHHI